MEKLGCNWCFGLNPDVKLVQVRADKGEWQSPIYMCIECRKHLMGVFRYVKEKKNDRNNK